MASIFPEPKQQRRITFDIKATISGWTLPGEDAEKATARIALETEILVNARGDIRAHITVVDGDEV